MADEKAPVESSTAVADVFEVPRDPEAYAKFRETGELPAPKDPKPKTEPPARSKEPSETDPQSEPASEPGTHSQQGKRKSDASARLDELLADLRTAGLTPAELKTFRKQAAAAEPPKPEAPKPEQTVKPAAEELKPPKLEDFKTFDEYQAAQGDYFEKLAEKRVEAALRADRQKQAQEAFNRDIAAKMDAAKARYSDDTEAATKIVEATRILTEDQQIPAALKDVIGGSKVLFDALYALGSKPEDMAAFVHQARTDPAGAMRRFVLIEQLVQQELAKGSTEGEQQRDDSGKFIPATPAKPRTAAPPPPREASGRQAAPPDPSDAAAASGNFRAFMQSENAKDLARRKGM